MTHEEGLAFLREALNNISRVINDVFVPENVLADVEQQVVPE